MYKRHNNEISDDETSLDGSKTETSDLSSAAISASYGSTPVQDETVDRFYIPFCGMVFYVMAFASFFCAMMLRESLSVAIVAMVNHTTAGEADVVGTNDSNQCPRDPELQHESGEFTWSRNQQGILLAAFYYGFEITQVSQHNHYIHVGLPVYFIERSSLV